MQGRFYDGLIARPSTVEVEWADDGLRFKAGETRFWSRGGLKVVREGDQARLSHPSEPDARLVLFDADWTMLGGSFSVEKRGRAREFRLVAGLAAVVAHEVAHIEQRHVMQAVWRSLGVGLLLDAVVGGGTGAGQQAVLLAGQATDLRYGREAELEADARGQALLVGAGLSSQGMAPFFERMHGAGEDERLATAAEFVSTHPDSGRRAQRARHGARPGAAALSPSEWAAVRASCGTGSKDPVTRLKDRLRRRGDKAPVDQGDQVGQD